MLPPRKPNFARVNRGLSHLAAILASAIVLMAMATPDAHAANSFADNHSKYYKAALAAARKYDGPDTKISGLKVARGFARALILNTSVSPQSYTAIFKVHSVRSMKVIASGSAIDPVALVELHMPFATQVKLTWSGSEKSLRHAVATEGEYAEENTPGFTGFDGSFGPDSWELDAGRFDGIEHALSKAVHKRNAHTKNSKRTIDVDAAYKFNRHSKITVNKTTYLETFTLKLAFVSETGTFTKHTLKATQHPAQGPTGSSYYTYKLDGHHIAR